MSDSEGILTERFLHKESVVEGWHRVLLLFHQ